MRWIVPLLFLQASPARWSRSSLEAILHAPVPTGRYQLMIRTSLGTFDGVWLHDRGRDHLAVRDPLGPPVVIVRSNGEQLGVEFLGRPEVVARADEAVRWVTDGVSLSELVRLLEGRIPEGAHLERVRGGWVAKRGQLDLRLGIDGQLLSARWRGVQWANGTLQVGDQALRIERVGFEPMPVPSWAFEIGRGETVAVETLGRILFAPPGSRASRPASLRP